jgi:hypothetical protein
MPKYKYPMVLVHAVDLSSNDRWHDVDIDEKTQGVKEFYLLGWRLPYKDKKVLRFAMVHTIDSDDYTDVVNDWFIPRACIKSIRTLITKDSSNATP